MLFEEPRFARGFLFGAGQIPSLSLVQEAAQIFDAKRALG
jgi:hypothetical protein